MNVTKISEKKLKRIENKKKKLLALANITKLNDKERQNSVNETGMEVEFGNLLKNVDSFSNLNKSSKHKYSKEEPASKKHKPLSNLHVSTYTSVNNSTSNSLKSINSSVENGPMTQSLTEEEYALLKYELNQRKKFLTKIPRIRVRDDGLKAAINTAPKNRVPLFMKDIQHMLAFCLFGPYLKPYTTSPRWCLIEKFNRIENVNLVVIENLSLDDYFSNEDKFQFLHNQFSVKVEIINPFMYDGDVVPDLSAVSITDNDRASLLDKFGDETEIIKNDKKIFRLFKPAFSVTIPSSMNDKAVPDKFPRTYLLLSLWQMVVENYPVPIKGELSNKYANYRMSKDVYEEVSDNSPLFSVDCEMCLTTTNENELTRITIVNEEREVVYESLVKPYNQIVNYLTKFSGITEEMLRNVDKRLEDVQDDIIKLLPTDAILVGHSLNIDLHVLKLMHPYVIDTSVIYNLSGERWRKSKLQTLAWEFLKLRIQKDNKGHDSVEDSISSLKLVQLKLSQSIIFGDEYMKGRQHLTDKNIPSDVNNEEDKNDQTLATSLFNILTRDNKTSTIVGSSKNIKRYQKFVTYDKKENCKFIEVPSNRCVIPQSYDFINKSKFTLHHLTIKEKRKSKYISSLDMWFSDLWNHFKDNSVCIILFVGSQFNNLNGVCFVETKKPFTPIAKPKLER